jgi:3-dehydroquinate synthase
MTNLQYINSNTVETINSYISGSNVMIITDSNVFGYYRSLIEDKQHIVLPPGENTKSLATAEKIIDKMSDLGCSRETLLIGFGGGVICDITGFVAATYKRGIEHGFIATSIIAQSDAALGGKNAVNVSRKKNLMGTFKMPQFVLCPVNVLKTLPDVEKTNGMAEVIKTALIGSKQLLEELGTPPQNWQKDYNFLFNAIKKAGMIKMGIVERDPYDHSERRILNFGHTLGHALESVYGIKHGFAVAAGMVHVLKLTSSHSSLDYETVTQVENILKKFGLPTAYDFDMEKIMAAIPNDRKTDDGSVRYICLIRSKTNSETINPDKSEFTLESSEESGVQKDNFDLASIDDEVSKVESEEPIPSQEKKVEVNIPIEAQKLITEQEMMDAELKASKKRVLAEARKHQSFEESVKGLKKEYPRFDEPEDINNQYTEVNT